MEGEIWKPVIGYETKYLVSNLGRIKSLFFKNPKIMKQTNCCGYLKITIERVNGKNKNEFCHRIVAKTFIDNTLKVNEVNHKNGKRNDNRVENLEWVSHQENLSHSVKVLGRKYKKGAENKFSKKIYMYDLNMNFIRELAWVYDIVDDNFKRTSIVDCALGNRKSYRGYIWSYEKLH